MWQRIYHWWQLYGVAISLVATALMLNQGLEHIAPIHSPYFFFSAAVVASSFIGGFSSGLVATGLSLLVINFFLLEPIGALAIADFAQAVQLAVFLFVGTILSLFTSVIRSVKQHLLRTPWQRYGIVLLVIAVVLILKLQLYVMVPRVDVPYLLFYAAVIIGARFGGLGPGLLATLLGAVLGDYFFIEPRYALHLGSSTDALRMLVFILEGTLICIIASALYSAREFAEQQARKLQDQQQQLFESEERLRRTQRLDAVGRLAAGLAHDFNNLLNIISAHSGLMKQELPPDSPHREATRHIEATALRASELTRQLLAFGRQQVLQPCVLDLNAVIADLRKLFGGLLRQGIQLKFALGPDLWPVKADRGQLEQVLMNLAVNARDAIGSEGTITIGIANVTVDAASNGGVPEVPPGDYVLLSVRDTGSGMDAQTRAHLFEPFYTTKGPGKGTGLGLATVYGIVTQSGGHVAVESVLGEGTAFRVYLPRHT